MKTSGLRLKDNNSSVNRLLSSSKAAVPKDLPDFDYAMKILVGALAGSADGGLDKIEIQRLNMVANLARTYKELLADYINCGMIEERLFELEEKYARLVKGNEQSGTLVLHQCEFPRSAL
jgi:hypothetical protein